MTREELIERLAARADVPRHSAQVFLHACFDVVKSTLRAGEEVQLSGLGHWTPNRSEDGRLTAVTYAAFVSGDIEHDVLHGPASSIDARHFIPAEALEPRPEGRPDPIDISLLVTDVRRALGHLPAEESPVSAADAVEDDAATIVAETDADEWSVVGDHDEPLIEHEELDAEVPALPGEEELAVVSDDGSDAYTEDPRDGTATLPDEEQLLEAEMEAEGYLPEEEHGEAEEDEDLEDPLSATEVFHRNRDQLYHPPEEPSRRKLVVTAAVLTFCVLVIIVYLLLDQGEPRNIPGSQPVGATPTLTVRHA